MIVALLLGLGAGAGLLVAGRAVRPRPMPLTVALRQLEAPARRVAPTPGAGAVPARRGWTTRIEGSLGDRLVRDLRVVARTSERHALDKLTTSVALGALPIGASLTLGAVGFAPSTMIAVVLAGGGVLSGFWIPDLLVRKQASARRRQFTFALSSYLDLVNVLLAGGAGVETALHATADAGDGWAFEQLRSALVRASVTRRSPWVALSELGEELGIDELVELAASIQLAGEEGARIRSSLAAKAASLRGRQLARIEADAHAASERMGFPTVAMFLGFLALLAYPAVQQIAGS